jgi:hypothetical protein
MATCDATVSVDEGVYVSCGIDQGDHQGDHEASLELWPLEAAHGSVYGLLSWPNVQTITSTTAGP